MTSRRLMLIGLAAALVCSVVSTAAIGRGLDHKTRFTFTRSVELPGGITLQPGKYTFRLVESLENRHIVEVLDEHEMNKLATVLAIDPLAEAVVMFGETPPDLPQPMRFWYHAGRAVGSVGYEFVYPTEQAARIARTTNQHVVMTDAPLSDIDALRRAPVFVKGPPLLVEHPAGPTVGPASSLMAAERTRTSVARETSNAARRGLSAGTIIRSSVGFSGSVLLAAAVVALIALRQHLLRTTRPTLFVRER